MDTASLTILVTAVIGAVEAVQALFDGKPRTTVTILIAAAVGAVMAPHLGFTWTNGMYLGLTGSGVVTLATKVSSSN
jgi:hypothetical protein